MNCLRSEKGSALLEFSLIVPLLVLMFVGVVDFGLAISQAITVTQAAEAGAQYGTLAGNTADFPGMVSAATRAANGLSGFSVTPYPYAWCSCTPAGTVVSCSSSCSNSASPIEYIQVGTTATVSVLANYPGLPTTITIVGRSILRVQ